MTSERRLASPYRRLTQLATTGLGRPQDGRVTWARVAIGLVLPAFILGLSVGSRPRIEPAALLSAASIVSGVLLALCTLGIGRVKDLATEHDGARWTGLDPMPAAYDFAKAAVSTTYFSFVVTALFATQLWITATALHTALVALSLALAAALASRIWFLLGHIRYQIEAMAGQRSVRLTRLRKVK